MLEVTLASLQRSDQKAVDTVGFHFELPAVQTPNSRIRASWIANPPEVRISSSSGKEFPESAVFVYRVVEMLEHGRPQATPPHVIADCLRQQAGQALVRLLRNCAELRPDLFVNFRAYLDGCHELHVSLTYSYSSSSDAMIVI